MRLLPPSALAISAAPCVVPALGQEPRPPPPPSTPPPTPHYRSRAAGAGPERGPAGAADRGHLGAGPRAHARPGLGGDAAVALDRTGEHGRADPGLCREPGGPVELLR